MLKMTERPIHELYRILKCGGFGIVMVPILLTLFSFIYCGKIKDTNLLCRKYGRNASAFIITREHNFIGYFHRNKL